MALYKCRLLLVSGRLVAQNGVILQRPFKTTAPEGKRKEAVVEEPNVVMSDVDLNSVCAGLNYFNEGEDPPIKPDSEYPKWLWTHLDRIDTYEELPPELAKSARRHEKKKKLRQNNALRKELKR